MKPFNAAFLFKQVIRLSSFFLCLFLMGCTKTYYVDGAYSGTSTGAATQPFKTIQAALAIAAKKDTIYVLPGLYREHIELKEEVHLISTLIGGAVLHGGADRSGGHPTVTGANDASLIGFTITGGYDGILCKGTSPLISRNMIRSNYGDGGIVCLDGSKARLINNTILGNIGSKDGVVFSGIYVENAKPEIRNNIITGNDFGIAAYQASPVEAYNNVWGNRTNFGYNASPGTGTISQDPGFSSIPMQDYRLSATSPCRNAGDPANGYKDADGSRNDMGAFDGDGGYAIPIPVQEYFVESVLNVRHGTTAPLVVSGLSHYVSDLEFWFPPAERGSDEALVKPMLTKAVAFLTDGRYQAKFISSPNPPANPCNVITVSFGTPRGLAYLKGGQAPNCISPNGHAQGADIIGGELVLRNYSAPQPNDPYELQQMERTLVHELGHVGILAHYYRGYHSMSYAYEQRPQEYSATEKAAIKLQYAYPTGTSLDKLIADGKITRNVMEPFPVIEGLGRWDGTKWLSDARDNATGPPNKDYWAKPGDYILLQGSRLTLRHGAHNDTFLPPAYQDPVVYFDDLAVTANATSVYQWTTAPTVNWQGGPVRYLKVQVPANAKSGWVYIRSRGLESCPVYLEIR